MFFTDLSMAKKMLSINSQLGMRWPGLSVEILNPENPANTIQTMKDTNAECQYNGSFHRALFVLRGPITDDRN